MRTIHHIVLALAVLGLASCASITRGSYDVLHVTASESNALITVERIDRDFAKGELKRNPAVEGNTLQAVAPAVFNLKRKGDYKVTATKRGFQPATAQVDSKIVKRGAAGMLGNVFFGGFIGAGVDVISGATKGLRPNPVHLSMAR